MPYEVARPDDVALAAGAKAQPFFPAHAITDGAASHVRGREGAVEHAVVDEMAAAFATRAYTSCW